VAQKIQTLYVDDLDGGEAEGAVRFGLDATPAVSVPFHRTSEYLLSDDG